MHCEGSALAAPAICDYFRCKNDHSITKNIIQQYKKIISLNMQNCYSGMAEKGIAQCRKMIFSSDRKRCHETSKHYIHRSQKTVDIIGKGQNVIMYKYLIEEVNLRWPIMYFDIVKFYILIWANIFMLLGCRAKHNWDKLSFEESNSSRYVLK